MNIDFPEGFNNLAKCRHGIFLYNRNDEYVGSSLELYGEFSPGEADLFSQLLVSGSPARIVEVGANIGALTIPIAKHIGRQGIVYAYEPQRLVFQTLCANIALNQIENVVARCAAVGSDKSEIRVPTLDPRRENNFGALNLDLVCEGELTPMVRLDDEDIDGCNLLKIDAEGMEYQVIQGALELIAKERPVLFVENDRKEKGPALVRLIRSLQYTLYWHIAPLFVESNYRRNTTNVFPGVASGNMLCIPEELNLTPIGLLDVAAPEETFLEAAARYEAQR